MRKLVWRRAASFPLPPPPPPPPPPSPLLDFYPTSQPTDSGWGTSSHDSPLPPPPPPLILPSLNEGRYCPIAQERIRRGVRLRKAETQSYELDMYTARQMLLKQVQQGIKLKPASSDVTRLHLTAPRRPHGPAPSKEWQRSPSQLHPLPDVLQNFQYGEGVCGTQANDLLFPPRPLSRILPVLNEGQRCPLALDEIKRGVNFCVKTARQDLMKQIQQGVKLRPVSPDVITEILCSDTGAHELMGRNCFFIEYFICACVNPGWAPSIC